MGADGLRHHAVQMGRRRLLIRFSLQNQIDILNGDLPYIAIGRGRCFGGRPPRDLERLACIRRIAVAVPATGLLGDEIAHILIQLPLVNLGSESCCSLAFLNGK